MTLVEVLIALAIFLLAMVVFGEMIVHNAQVALDVQRQNLATRLCRSKLQEVMAGVVPLTSQDGTPFDEEPDYSWSVDAENGAVEGLWIVTVHVTRQQTDGGPAIDCTLMQMILDPAVEGSTQDTVPVVSSTTTSSSGSSTSATTGSTGQ
jgi:type II secretory pathway pseudopilin PulG